MPRAAPNPIEAAIETILPRPVIDIFSALGRLVYSIILSRRVNPDSWQDTLVPPLIALLLAYGSLLIAYRTVRNSFNLAWYGVKYGALIGSLIAVYAWWMGVPDGSGAGRGYGASSGGGLLQDLAGGGAAGGNGMLDGILGGIVGGGNGAGAGAGRGAGGGALDMLHTLGRLGQGGAAAIPLLSAVMAHFQDGQQGAGRRRASNGRPAQQQRQGTRPRRSTRLRNNARANANTRRRSNVQLDELDDDYEEEYDNVYDSDEAFIPRSRRASSEDAAIRAVKSLLRWVGQATAPEADDERGRNPSFPPQQQERNDDRRRRRRADPSLFDLD
ncbi:hypothetical protein OC846_006160 [Tilletia horrida]|uniref:Uncharacterized protein n=1 Tax=Tilletia horrida TaxID=155126 RepID=A0AAN6JNW1_9BASI|nr:hypothetical protein OC846_006160 [Tilletia horrida]